MKNYLLLSLALISLALTSCRNDDNTTEQAPEKKILLSKITTTYYDNPSTPQTSIDEFEYNSKGEIIKANSGNSYTTIEYENEKPIKTNHFTNNSLSHYSSFKYNDSLLVSINSIYVNSEFNRTTKYTYNLNKKISSSSLCEGINCNPIIRSYKYEGDNIKTETSENFYSTKTEYTYDDKSSPFTHVNKYIRIMMEGAYALSKNNYTKEKISYKNNNEWINNQNITYEITYNEDKFPIQVIGKESNGNNYVKYNYEYIRH